MDNQPSFDRSLLFPAGVGIFSLIGICVILMLGRLNSSGAVVEEAPTSTAFQFAYIGTEPAISTVTLETVEELPTFTPEPFDTHEIPESPDTFETPVPPGTSATNTLASLITLPPLVNTSTPTRTPTSAFAAPFGSGTYDNTDSRFVYSDGWVTQNGVPGAYQNTLHVSDTVGSSVRFLFIGNELRVFFQAAPSLGTIRLTLDTTTYTMSEASSNTQIFEWVLSASTTGTHTVTITHESGGSVNFDGIIVPVVPATPTNTPTATP